MLRYVIRRLRVSAVKAYRYYRTAIICAQEMSDELCYENEERHFNVETHVRWYEAIEKALVIWLHYLGFPVLSGALRGKGHRFHEAFLDTLGHPDNPFFEIFSRYGLLADLRHIKKFRNIWRHSNLPCSIPCEDWECEDWEGLAAYHSMVNDALEDAFTTFSEMRAKTRLAALKRAKRPRAASKKPQCEGMQAPLRRDRIERS